MPLLEPVVHFSSALVGDVSLLTHTTPFIAEKRQEIFKSCAVVNISAAQPIVAQGEFVVLEVDPSDTTCRRSPEMAGNIKGINRLHHLHFFRD